MSIDIPFTIKLIEYHDPNGPDAVFGEVMKNLIAEKQEYLNDYVQKEINRIFKKRLKFLRKKF